MREPCLYVGRVTHRRRSPVAHAFRYRIALLCFDVDEPAALERVAPWLGADRAAPISWRRSDHAGDASSSLGDTIRALVEDRTGARPLGQVLLVTSPRVLGYGFNPISLYLCHDECGDVEAVVAEVTSTPWQERHSYVLSVPASRRREAVQRFVTPKRLHVSPFLGMEQDYRWRLAITPERLSVGIVAATGSGRPFSATMSLARLPLTRASSARLLLQPALGAMGTMAAIHFEALRLWWKGAPYVPHPKHAAVPDGAGGSRHDQRACHS